MSHMISAEEFYLTVFLSELPSISNKKNPPNYWNSRYSYLNMTWIDFLEALLQEKKKSQQQKDTKLHEKDLHRKVEDRSQLFLVMIQRCQIFHPRYRMDPSLRGSSTAGFTHKLISVGFYGLSSQTPHSSQLTCSWRTKYYNSQLCI